MKILLSILIFTVSLVAYAGDSSVGCGLGYQVARKNSLISATSRFVTHIILPNTFSMTSGTSGCSKHSIVLNEKIPVYYVEANFQNLQIEMALGQGEFLKGLAQSLGCQDQVIEQFSTTIQANYNLLFKDVKQPVQVLNRVKTLIKRQSSLNKGCQHQYLI